MCRNITTLRGLEPAATIEEIDAAARQYVRKVSGVQQPSATTSDAVDEAVHAVAAATATLLAQLPPRRQPPATLPPLRRPEVRRKLGLEPVSRGGG
jgi:hypothetical protein